ncbi:hypothetical protein BRC74_02640 [Halobacteriales archaeon QH_7_68_42]|nr:MAG: hypothetical protein BRC74_02640 [Halobacteriales archaeon QH_7_68_42]
MLSEGAEAPAVELPGYVDGERKRVDLGAYLDEGIVVLAFYPADFNPACSMQSSDLDGLDLYTMQRDVSVFAVSPDSTYSHEAFAERYGLRVPLLSDADGAAASAYGVDRETETGEPLPRRAVFVVDHRGTVQYAWATDDLAESVDVDPVKRAVGDIGGDETALERYRAGVELDTAVRFAESEVFETVADRAEEKADTLQHAADWFAQSADALGGGRGKQGAEYREDAERVMDAASGLPEPPEHDAFTLTDAGIDVDDSVTVDSEGDRREPSDGTSGATASEGARAADGAVESDLALDEAAFDDAADGDAPEPTEGDTVEGDASGAGGAGGGNEARAPGGESTPGGDADGSQDGNSGEDEAAEDIEELDLADPTEGEEEEGDDDERADWDIPGQ